MVSVVNAVYVVYEELGFDLLENQVFLNSSIKMLENFDWHFIYKETEFNLL